MIRYARSEEPGTGRYDDGGSCHRLQSAQRDPVEFRTHPGRNDAGESERRATVRICAANLEARLTKAREQRFVRVGMAKALRVEKHLPEYDLHAHGIDELDSGGIEIAAEDRRPLGGETLKHGCDLEIAPRRMGAAIEMHDCEMHRFASHPYGRNYRNLIAFALDAAERSRNVRISSADLRQRDCDDILQRFAR